MVLTRFVAMTGIVLIGYLFNYTEIKGALFVRICFARLHGLAHTRGARGQGVVVIVIISDDDDSHNSIRGLEDLFVHNELRPSLIFTTFFLASTIFIDMVLPDRLY